MADTVSSAESTGSITYVGNTTRSKTTNLTADTSTFLKLLVAQLQYQDPLEPQTDTAFVTQLAQMTSVEQMQQMNKALSSSQAYSMIGKYAYAEVLNEKTGVTECYCGRVDSVVIKDSAVYVVVGENAIPISDVLQVYDESVISD
ncbi:hypothetical protein SDC9_49959 [bioreactor metagenome]|uniref:Basal-body rod modification protein FlgD n=1 Tax=bioreactor metagenome TaxID=1076179 RepID=A0A644WIV0_9ZZZZ